MCDHARLLYEIGRELRRNRIAFAQRAYLVVELARAAGAPLFGGQPAEALRRPESGNEDVVALALGKAHALPPLDRSVRAPAGEAQCRVPVTVITRKQNEILAGKEVDTVGRNQTVEPNAVAAVALDSHAQIGDDRIGESAGDDGYGALDVLLRPDEARRTAALEGQTLDEHRIDVSSDAEREDSRLATLGRGRRGNCFRPCLTDRRRAVGQHEHERQALVVRSKRECFVERARDVRRALRLKPVQILTRRAEVLWRCIYHRVAERAYVG